MLLPCIMPSQTQFANVPAGTPEADAVQSKLQAWRNAIKLLNLDALREQVRLLPSHCTPILHTKPADLHDQTNKKLHCPLTSRVHVCSNRQGRSAGCDPVVVHQVAKWLLSGVSSHHQQLQRQVLHCQRLQLPHITIVILQVCLSKQQ